MEDPAIQQINQQLDFIGVQKQINIVELQVTDLDYGKSITVVKYKITGTASSGKTTEVESEFILPKSQEKNFIPYEDVTEELVSKWIKSLDDNLIITEFPHIVYFPSTQFF